MPSLASAQLIPPTGAAPARQVAANVWRLFLIWTAIFWGGTVALGALFYVGAIDFVTSTRLSLYGTSIWLNAWLLPFVLPGASKRDLKQRFHEGVVLWMVCYTMTNALWEIPWVITSPFIFTDLHTLDDVVAQTGWMRESPLHMAWWVMASFSSVDLRTVNHDPTFYALEFFAFLNVASALYFYRLNKQNSALRYLVPVVGCGEPIAATFIFSFTEVFAGFVNMPGGLAETLLALVWTQYQYLFFPMILGWMACQLLLNDLHHTWTQNRAISQQRAR